MTRLFTNGRCGRTGEPLELLVENGRFSAVGPVVPHPEGLAPIDLDQRFVLPSLIDCHCHILPTGIDMGRLHLGARMSAEAALDAVADRHRSVPEGWLVAVHYDQNRWGGRHIARADLDAIDPDRPILLQHVNGHASVANSAALRAAGVGPNEQDPDDGAFGRDATGTLDGLLLEGAHERVLSAIPRLSLSEMADAIVRAAQSMSAWGIGSAADMQTEADEIDAYVLAAERGCPIRLRLYVVWRDVFSSRARCRELIEALRDRSGSAPVVAGVKLFADGAIGSGTAAIYGAFMGRPARPNGTSGQLMYAPDKLRARVRTAHDAGYQVATHAIGDYGLDVVLDAYEATGEPSRHRIEHGMLASDKQLDRIASAGIGVAMQPEFLVRLGHAYKAQLGSERAYTLNRYRSAMDAGIRLAFSSDRPICAGNPWIGIDAASARPEAFDPHENLSRVAAIERYLAPAAEIDGDVDAGQLKSGYRADAIVMRGDPRRPGTPSDLAILQEL